MTAAAGRLTALQFSTKYCLQVALPRRPDYQRVVMGSLCFFFNVNRRIGLI